MLKIKANNVLEFDGKKIKLGGDELPNFLLANLSQPVILGNGVSISELMNLMFHIKDFIEKYTCEDYHVINSVYSAMKMTHLKSATKIVARREMVLSHENKPIYPFFVSFELEKGSEPKKMLRDLCLEINQLFSIKNHNGEVIVDSIYQEFSLLDLIAVLFEELYHVVTSTSEKVH